MPTFRLTDLFVVAYSGDHCPTSYNDTVYTDKAEAEAVAKVAHEAHHVGVYPYKSASVMDLEAFLSDVERDCMSTTQEDIDYIGGWHS